MASKHQWENFCNIQDRPKESFNECGKILSVNFQERIILLKVSMLGPSPDWIVGVSALELCLANCTWLDSKTIALYPWVGVKPSNLITSCKNGVLHSLSILVYMPTFELH